MSMLYFDNAITWAQLRLRGGIQSLLMIAFSYAAIVLLIITLFYETQNNPRGRMDVLEATSAMLLIAQVCILILLGSMAVGSAIRRDIATHQIDSHRLMPLAPAAAILGYLTGGGVRILVLAAINLFIGMFAFRMRHIPITIWVSSNAILLGFALSVWTIMALSAFISRWVFWIQIVLFCAIGFSGGAIFCVAPGFLVFCTPMQKHTIFEVSTQVTTLSNLTLVGLTAQALLAFLCIRAAARKYANADSLAFRPHSALALTGICAAASWFGIQHFMDIKPPVLEEGDMPWQTVVVGAIACTLVAALLVMATLAWTAIMNHRRRLGGESVPARPWVFWICLPICVLFVLGLLTARPVYSFTNYGYIIKNNMYMPAPPTVTQVSVVHQRVEFFMIGISVAIFLIQAYLLMRLLYPAMRLANMTITFLVGLLWFGPLVADLFYYAMQDMDPKMLVFTPYSCIGTMMLSMTQPMPPHIWLGICGQAAICMVIAVIFWIVQSRRTRVIRARSSMALGMAPPPPLPAQIAAATQ